MHEILLHLGPGARVLDLGCQEGSFSGESCHGAQVVRLDRVFPSNSRDRGFVQADASRLPFRAGCFDAVIGNHCLEHFDDADQAIREIGRVIKRSGGLYVSVPDGSSWTDRVYRWVYHGGEHVNLFRSAEDLAARTTAETGTGLAAVPVLHSLLWFLNASALGPRARCGCWATEICARSRG